MQAPITKKVDNRHHLDEYVYRMRGDGYTVASHGERSAVLRKSSYGSVGIHIVLLLLTVGIGNVIYALAAKGEELYVEVDDR